MSNGDLHWIANYIWGIADDVLRDLYVRGKYRDVILPMTVLRRLDAVLVDSKPNVLEMKAVLDQTGVVEQDAARRQAAGQAFYNTSKFTLRDLRARASRQQLRADFEAYLDGFSPNVQDILENFEFRNQIPRLSPVLGRESGRRAMTTGDGLDLLKPFLPGLEAALDDPDVVVGGDALRAEGIDEAANLYHDVASGVCDDHPDTPAAPPSPEFGERQHQPHQVRLPREGVLLVDPLQVPVDGGVRMPRRLGHVAHALAFRQPDRHLRLRRRQFQGRGHQVGIDARLAPPGSTISTSAATCRAPWSGCGTPTGLTCTTNGGTTGERRSTIDPLTATAPAAGSASPTSRSRRIWSAGGQRRRGSRTGSSAHGGRAAPLSASTARLHRLRAG